MIWGAIVCPDSDLRERIQKLSSECRELHLAHRLNRYPDKLETTRFLQTSGAQLIFLSMEAPEQALQFVALAASWADPIEIVAITRQLNPQVLLSLMRAGVRHVLTAPFDAASLAAAVVEAAGRIGREREQPKGGNLYSFLPAKGGSGASTLALNAMLALGRESGEPALLIDLDFSSGVIGFQLDLPAVRALTETANGTLELDDAHWSHCVAKLESLHVVLPGALSPSLRTEMVRLRHLLEFTRGVYAHVAVDLADSLEAFSLEVLHESRQIVLVASLDPLGAHLAARKLNLLGRMDLDDRVRVVGVRTTERDWLTVEDMQDLLRREIDVVVLHDRAAVREAVETRAPVDVRSGLGKQCAQIGRLLRSPSPVSPPPSKPSYLERFAIPQSR